MALWSWESCAPADVARKKQCGKGGRHAAEIPTFLELAVSQESIVLKPYFEFCSGFQIRQTAYMELNGLLWENHRG